MLHRYIAVFFILGISLAGNLSLTQSVWGERLVNSTAETRLVVALRVGQSELQKLVPAPFQVTPVPGGPLKEANFMAVFIDAFLVHDAQGKPDIGGVLRAVVFAIPAKHSQTGEMVTVVIGGFSANPDYVPGAYKNFAPATIRREQTRKGANMESGVVDDFWEVQGTRGGTLKLQIQYQGILPSRAKSEQKIYSAAEPSFFRIYRLDTATDTVKSIPDGIDRVQKYQFHMAVPEVSKLFDGTEQLVGVQAIPLYLRQVFLP